MLVEVVVGPFTGARGRLERREGRHPTFVVTLELLGRSIAVPIEAEMVQPARC